MNYDGKHALVLGLGESGLAMAQWLAHCGARVRVADTREAPARLEKLRETVTAAEFVSGKFSASLLDDMDFVAVSPGLMPTQELAGILPAAKASNIPVWGEIELFAQALAALRETRDYAPKVIAITGTNGKTTVTRMTGMLCERAGLSVQVAGNISPAALDVLRKAMKQDALPEVWVLELSSFQLHSTYSLEADAATVLNVTQDHLDWHGDMDAYAADKARIFGTRTVRVLNRDDERVMQMAVKDAPTVSFGLDEPQRVGHFGLQEERDMTWLCVAVAAEAERQVRRRKNAVEEGPVRLDKLMPADALKVRGRHNASNALAALALCRAIGLPFAPLLYALREYRGESHRVEVIARVGGVEYVDDSKGTNVGATVAALEGLGNGKHRRQVLIAGGDGKGQDFSPLAKPVADHVHTVLLIGQDADTIRMALKDTGAELVTCDSLEQAVQLGAAAAHEGDIVLLSPACASMDMFVNYVHRAQVFKDAVQDVAAERGEVVS